MLIELALASSIALAGTCDYGARHPEAPEELEQFAFLVGDYEIRAYGRQGDGWTQGYLTTDWNGRWALDGFAIYDEWFDVQWPNQEKTWGRGANLRLYKPDMAQWVMVWAHTSPGAPGQDLRAQQRGDRMVMWQVHPEKDTDWKAEFEILDDGHWVRYSYIRPFGTDEWEAEGKLEAIRKPCEADG